MGRAGSCGWEGLKAGQWEEEKAWGAPNVVEEKRGCHLQEDFPPIALLCLVIWAIPCL